MAGGEKVGLYQCNYQYEASSGALSLTFDCNCKVGSGLECFDFIYKLHEK